jgi:hypothetical protein
MQKYVIVHTKVGRWREGQIVSAEDLDGIDVGRLLALGAIRRVHGVEAEGAGEAVPLPDAPTLSQRLRRRELLRQSFGTIIQI